jgi:Uma2 family endonuclease
MSAMPVADRMTAEEFLALPGQDLHWAELIGGELVVDVPILRHQLICSEILFELMAWARAAPDRGVASIELAVRIGERDVYQPDLVWYCADRAPARDDRPPYKLPDLAVEIRSPSTWRYDIGAKQCGYERRGLPELWLVDTAADEVLVFRRTQPGAPQFDVALELTCDETLPSPLLPGFAIALTALFGS